MPLVFSKEGKRDMASRFHLKEIDILGTTYTIKCYNMNEVPILKDNNFEGFCNFDLKTILLSDLEEEPFHFENVIEKNNHEKLTLRHEIIHAFLMESGLWGCGLPLKDIPWSVNEEMIDWFAIQSPKIYEIYRDLDIL